jgi:competence protein ComEA
MFKTFIAIVLAFFAAAAFASVDINKANQAELEAVKGLGTVTAGKIIDERKKGEFKSWADVQQRMSGIKDARATRLSNAGLTVGGETYKSTGEPSTTKGKGKGKGDKFKKLSKEGKAAKAADKASDAKSGTKQAAL